VQVQAQLHAACQRYLMLLGAAARRIGKKQLQSQDLLLLLRLLPCFARLQRHRLRRCRLCCCFAFFSQEEQEA
jgi:hypothetical protein